MVAQKNKIGGERRHLLWGRISGGRIGKISQVIRKNGFLWGRNGRRRSRMATTTNNMGARTRKRRTGGMAGDTPGARKEKKMTDEKDGIRTRRRTSGTRMTTMMTDDRRKDGNGFFAENKWWQGHGDRQGATVDVPGMQLEELRR